MSRPNGFGRRGMHNPALAGGWRSEPPVWRRFWSPAGVCGRCGGRSPLRPPRRPLRRRLRVAEDRHRRCHM